MRKSCLRIIPNSARQTFVKCADLIEIDVIVTDEKADKKYLERIREEGLEIEIAKLPRQKEKEPEKEVLEKGK